MAHDAAGRGTAHEVASRAASFGHAAADYARARPGFPDASIRYVLGAEPSKVLDLGAGTGKLTRSLLALGHEVIAVEPDPVMLAQLTSSLPDVVAKVAGAEDIPLPDGSVDAALAGQAYHWFDPARALPQIARVLRRQGVLGLLWNVRDERVPWVEEFGELIGGHEDGTKGSDEDSEPPDLQGFFGPATVNLTTHEWPVDGAPGLVALAASRSYVITRPAEQRAALLDQVRALGERVRPTAMPYVTQAWRAEKA